MTDQDRSRSPATAVSLNQLLHELAESLQAATAYLRVARRAQGTERAIWEFLEKGESQLIRANEAFDRLRGQLIQMTNMTKDAPPPATDTNRED